MLTNKKMIKYHGLSHSNILKAFYPTVEIIDILFVSYFIILFSYCSVVICDYIFDRDSLRRGNF